MAVLDVMGFQVCQVSLVTEESLVVLEQLDSKEYRVQQVNKVLKVLEDHPGL